MLAAKTACWGVATIWLGKQKNCQPDFSDDHRIPRDPRSFSFCSQETSPITWIGKPTPAIHCKLKGRDFCFWFFHESVSPQPQSIPLGQFRILRDIRKSRCTTSIKDTGANLPSVSTTPAEKIADHINDTGGKFAIGINDTGGKFCHQFCSCC
jgi:hypothetical protein